MKNLNPDSKPTSSLEEDWSDVPTFGCFGPVLLVIAILLASNWLFGY
jgi:hypothetical protein